MDRLSLKHLSNRLLLACNSLKVFIKLIRKGHIYEEVSSENFKLQAEITFTGDWQNFIYYTGKEDLNQNEIEELLALDEELLEKSKELMEKLRSYFRGLRTIPWLFSLLLSAGIVRFTQTYWTEEFASLIHEGSIHLTQENWHAALGTLSPLLIIPIRKKAINLVMLFVRNLI